VKLTEERTCSELGIVEAKQIHHGTARLRVLSHAEMDGYYYIGGGRGYYGSIYAVRLLNYPRAIRARGKPLIKL
jgi:hypothetical protein